MSSITVRSPVRADLRALVRLEVKCHAAAPAGGWMNEEELVRFVGAPDTRVFVAEEGEENLVGFALLTRPDGGAELILNRLRVDPDYAGCEAADVLLAAAEVYNRKSALKDSLVAYVREDDLPAQQFFARRGFVSALARNHFGDRDGVRFSRQLP